VHETDTTATRDGRLPIVIGVTGHRDLPREDLEEYRRGVADLIARFRRRYPATPLRVLSPLAAGADRLVAEVALETGCELVVPLPFPAAEYERDFPDSVDEFRRILAQVAPANVFVLPPVAAEEGVTVRDPEHRDLYYRRVGEYIAAHSHVLVALWDGQPSDSDAGTAAVVRLKLEGGADWYPGSVLDPDDAGPVYHLRASRSGRPTDGEGRAEWLYPEDADGRTFDTVGLRIDRFNAEALTGGGAAALEASAAALLPGLDARPAGDRAVAVAFARADRLAIRYQKITHRVVRITLLLAACLAILFEVYAHVAPWRSLPIAYLAVFATISALYLWQRRIDAQGRYLDYRALAEGLRVQFYWRVAGLDDAVSASYLRRQLDELRWIREALRGACAAPPTVPPRVDLVLDHWVRGQGGYYRARTGTQRHRIHVAERWSWAFFGAGLATTTSIVFAWNVLHEHAHWHHWLVLVMGFAPVGAALCEAFGEKFALRTQANQYARFAAIFGRAEQFLARLVADDPPARARAEREVLRELGREALMENGDWVLLFRDRPIVLPKG
jgi:hypothetical protein